jgi:hypothetical protein
VPPPTQGPPTSRPTPTPLPNPNPPPPQDELIAAKAAVLEAEKSLKLRELEVVERDRKVRGCPGGGGAALFCAPRRAALS